MSKIIGDTIHKSLVKVVSDKYEEVKKKFLEDLEKAKDVEVAAIALHVFKMLDVQSMSDRTIITIRKETK